VEKHRDGPTQEEVERHRDEGYRKLGRYIAVFSEMIGEMQLRMVMHLHHPSNHPLVAWIPFGGATARDITDQFFAMASLVSKHDENEAATAAKLKSDVLDEIKRRNDVAHGEWFIGYWSTTGGVEGAQAAPPDAMRIKPERKAGILDNIEEDLDERSDAVERLRDMLRDYGKACFMPLGLHVSDVLRLEGKKGKQRTLVPGPKAPKR
jgi:hypothetical protein